MNGTLTYCTAMVEIDFQDARRLLGNPQGATEESVSKVIRKTKYHLWDFCRNADISYDMLTFSLPYREYIAKPLDITRVVVDLTMQGLSLNTEDVQQILTSILRTANSLKTLAPDK